MVFDNADVLSPDELVAYLPPGRGGNFLITSRNPTLRILTLPENSLEVMEMEENDAIELLLKASCLDSSSMEFQAEASNIVKELFCLPLAIDHAGAYIASGASTIGDYLAKYSEYQKTLFSHSEFVGASKHNIRVYGTWELSYKEIKNRAESNDPHKANAANSAICLLELFPFFHHEGITEEIFSYAALQKGQKTSNPEWQLASSMLDQILPLNKAGTWDNSLFREGIRVLLLFSLIKKEPSDGMYAIHPLVHNWGRDRLTLDERKKCCLMAYIALASSLRKDGSQQYEFQRVLVTHVRATIEHSKSESGQNIVGYLDDAYVKFGDLLWKQGYPKEAETLQIEVLDTRSRILGVKHPDTIHAMGNLAKTFESLGKYGEAEKLEIQVLDGMTRILGVEHPDTIRAMANLGATYYSLGKYTEAEKLDIQVLDARKRILGVDHTEAKKLEIQVLDVRKRILGVEHPNTIRAMANLAATYHNLGRYTEAEKLNIQVLDTRNRILGVEHPDTIMAMADLAETYDHLGKYTDAKKLKAQVLDSRTKISGQEHPDAIMAEKLQVQVLDAGNKVAETEYPHITGAMTNPAPASKQLVLVAKTALHHLQHCGAEIKAALSLSGISEMDYILLAGFNESVIHSGIGYLEEIHVLLKSEFPFSSDILSSLGRIFSPFSGMIFTTFPPYFFKTPVFNNEGKTQEWDEVVFTQAHTYTTLRMGNKMKEMELMSANIYPNEGKAPSGSGSGGSGDGNEKKQEGDPPQGRRIDHDPQRGGENKSEGDDDDSEGDDPDNPELKGSSGADLSKISFNIQTEIYPNAPPVLSSEPSSSKPSKFFQVLQLEGSITVQVGYPSKLIHKKNN